MSESLDKLLGSVGCDLSFKSLEKLQLQLDPSGSGLVPYSKFMEYWSGSRPMRTTMRDMMHDVRYARALRSKP